ncbi:proton channel OTOP3 [Xenopus tropicalis]|uniref:Proton channel OTOP3 n=1 Tax=Xenopus tropicalis TaxID=8364 RepID=A0A8J0R745_XENTR|nr:proton channel OTOP3 [Xenopus tropicalis]|eukprot:XP_004918534.1 PREDICTED: otopetrin-3-like isoform X1 [Xenopus tropicalis]
MASENTGEQATCKDQYMDLDAPGNNLERSWFHRHCEIPTTLHRRAKKTGRLFSGLFGSNLIFMGGTLVTSVVLSNKAVPERDLQSFLCILMLLSSVWALYHLLYVRNQNGAVYHDHHAGAMWLKASLALFGVCSILLSIFEIGHALLLQNCEILMDLVFFSIEIVFVSVQTVMLWVSCKDCVQMHHSVARYGIMLTLATDILLWLTAVIDDSLEQELQILQSNSTQDISDEMAQCQCPTSMCWGLKQGYVTMFRFNIEYSLICATLLFIMWKNVGRREKLQSDPPQHTFQLRGIIYGPMIGGAALLVGISIFVQYQIEATSGMVSSLSFYIYYSYKVIILPPMIACSVAGIIAHSLREKEKKGQKETGRSDQDWLHMEDVGSENKNTDYSSGQYQSSQGDEKIQGYSLEPFHYTQQGTAQTTDNELDNEKEKIEHRQGNTKKKHNTHQGKMKNYTRKLDVTLLFVSAVGQLGISYFSIIATVITTPWTMLSVLNFFNSLLLILQYLSQTMFIIESIRGIQEEQKESPGHHEESHRRMSVQEMHKAPPSCMDAGHLGLSRRVVKETAMFLMICNIMCWIMGAFGAHPLYMNGLERQLYGSGIWLAILNIGLPLSVFYRMHSVGILLEVYLHA